MASYHTRRPDPNGGEIVGPQRKTKAGAISEAEALLLVSPELDRVEIVRWDRPVSNRATLDTFDSYQYTHDCWVRRPLGVAP